ncbi:MAG TPA: kelch repeat-containing protein [Methylocystis sp.]|nr:kelch repeat-containing protein [Methylocystis sp.]
MTGTWTTFPVPDSSTGTFTADVMILLTDGSLLVHNGYTSALDNASQWLRLTPDHNGKYETGSWSSQLDMNFARQWFASGVLRDGRVFCIGGEDSTAGSDTPTGEIFDPLTNQWSDISKPSAFDFVRGDCNGSVLADGRVLLGGATPSGPPPSWSKRTAIWDPRTDAWVEAGLKFGTLASTDKKDPFEEETFVLLRDGSVLAPAVRDTPKAQRYVPLLDEWVHVHDSPVPLAIDTLSGVGVFETGPAILLPSGKVFVIGGTGQTALFAPGPHLNSPGSWTTGPVFPPDTSASPNWPTLTALDAPACLLPNGKVVCLGGATEPDAGDYFSFNPIFLEYDPHNPATTLPLLDVQPTLPAGNWTWQSCFLLLPTGQLLCSAQTNQLFLYTPDLASGLPHHDWKPAHIEVPECMAPGHSYRLSGAQINGLSQAVCYGDDAGMATNYPIVRLSNPISGQIVYVRSHDFSMMGVAPADLHGYEDRHSCRIDIPSSLPLGHWDLVVVANGIASDSIRVRIATRCEEDRFVGKVEALTYDRFGDFESFMLETTSGGVHQFYSHEPRIGDLARRAWQERARIAVKVDPGHPQRPESISFSV